MERSIEKTVIHHSLTQLSTEADIFCKEYGINLSDMFISFLQECRKLNSNTAVPNSYITMYDILSCLYLKPMYSFEFNKNIPDTLYNLIKSLQTQIKACDEDLRVMAKVYVETSRIKYHDMMPMTEDWYVLLPIILSCIAMMYRENVNDSEELYKFQEKVLKCIITYAEDLKKTRGLEQNINTLIECLISNPYLPGVPLKELFQLT